MNVPIWVAELGRLFWARARQSEPFPRNLRRPIAWAVPLAVVSVPRLSVQAALGWLQKGGLVCAVPGKDRPLRGCLVAQRGVGIALVDGADDEAEQAFTIAHELAHFLRDHWDLRRQIRKRLGAAILEVVDGDRPPTTEERLHALLRHVPLGLHWHLMERDSEGNPARMSIAQAEDDADRLAYELLAPAEHVLAQGTPGRSALIDKLRGFYGLPATQAARYARILVPRVHSDPLILRWKGGGHS